MAVSTESVKGAGDLIVHEYNQVFTRESIKLANPETEDIIFPVGTPVLLNGTPVEAADIATCTAITADKCYVEAESNAKIAGIARGPVVINKAGLPTVDYLGATINTANFVTRLKALGFVVRDDLVTQEEQTT